MANNLKILILAAGKGTRMNSSFPKVLHHLNDKSMLEHVLEQSKLLKPKKIFVLINKEMRFVTKLFPKENFLIQQPQLGTGHAVMTFLKKVKISNNEKLLVLYGDNPLIEKKDIQLMFEKIKKNNLVLLGFKKINNQSYGIIVKNNKGIDKIVEFKEASKKERKINICNSGMMAFDNKALKLIKNIKNNNKKKEYYLTDIVEISKKNGLKINLVLSDSEKNAVGVNSQIELIEAEQIMQERLRKKFIKQGVKFIDPNTVYFSSDTKIGKNVKIEPFVVIGKKVKIGDNVVIKSFSHIEEAVIKNKVEIGPFARIRPGSNLEEGVKIGNFVEVKKSKIEKGSKVNHLSYIGDASIGKNVNIGAGTITCNYDGKKKSKTIIKDNAFIGSNTSLIAPVIIGKNSLVGAGSSISKNVKDNNLALTRAEQKSFKKNK
jgi:bifunctional UDP-N-acetylglucosamine pyrophosphorylase/glucosamine-1-phosphate N-acetyltransferase